jgi:hypothetical protein
MTPELPPPSAAPELRLMNNARRIRDTGLAILVWIVLIGVFFWGLAHIAGPVLMFALGAHHRLHRPAGGDRGGHLPARRRRLSGVWPARRSDQ